MVTNFNLSAFISAYYSFSCSIDVWYFLLLFLPLDWATFLWCVSSQHKVSLVVCPDTQPTKVQCKNRIVSQFCSAFARQVCFGETSTDFFSWLLYGTKFGKDVCWRQGNCSQLVAFQKYKISFMLWAINFYSWYQRLGRRCHIFAALDTCKQCRKKESESWHFAI